MLPQFQNLEPRIGSSDPFAAPTNPLYAVVVTDFLAGALSCFFCSSCLCFVTCCCLFLSLSFLPPLSPMPAPFQRLCLEVWITARLIIRNRREPTLPQLRSGRVTAAKLGFPDAPTEVAV